ncbi:MAG: serine hydrolase domain-containing protein [Imperialibacter sp.]|uniref:serine hydrolase domain-containing protein n=1 Tax=Imperialibacter sp. TaxID=2038411 RepID=UPI0032ED5455
MKKFSYLLLATFFAYSCEQPETTLLIKEGSDLSVSSPIESELAKGVADTFRIHLEKGALASGFADQRTVDVVVKVFGPENQLLGEFDNPARGPEPFQLASEGGLYKIVVSPFEDGEGEYVMVLERVEAIANTKEGKIDQLMKFALGPDEAVPGATVAVVEDGKVTFSKGYGYANLEYDIKNTPTTIFHVASVSKQFTGFAIAMLADQGKISMDDDIRKYLPEMHDFGEKITLNHLVHHTSGLRDQWSLLALAGWRLDDVITREQVLRLIFKQTELNFKPGEEMLYCNTGFTLLAEIVSRVTGQSFAEWTKANMFDPLGMKNTLFYDDHEKIVKGRAYSYYKNDHGELKKSVLSYANVGATSLFTTVEDLALWAVNFENVSVGNDNVMKMMDQRYILNKGDTMGYGFGQGIGNHKGLVNKTHGGADAGYRTFINRFPEQRFSVIVFSNLASFNPGNIAYQIADIYLKDQLTEIPAQPLEAPPADDQPKEDFDASSVTLSEYTGRFYSPELETTYMLEVVNDTLVAHHQRHDDIKLTIKQKDEFSSSAWWTGNINFTRNSSNTINGFKVNAGRVRNVAFEKQ